MEKEPGFIATHNSSVRTRDFVVEAEFTNSMNGDMDYGFIVRNPVFNRLEVIGLKNYQYWFHYTRNIGDEDYTDLEYERLLSPFFGNPAWSRVNLLLIAVEESAWFFDGDRLIAKLDLTHNQEVGSISVMGDFFSEDQGKPEFQNFNVWAP